MQIHWFSILNSIVTVLLLSAVCAVILLRTLRQDIARYNDEDQVRRQHTVIAIDTADRKMPWSRPDGSLSTAMSFAHRPMLSGTYFSSQLSLIVVQVVCLCKLWAADLLHDINVRRLCNARSIISSQSRKPRYRDRPLLHVLRVRIEIDTCSLTALSAFAGYFGGRLYKTVKGTNWIKAGLASAVTYPAIVSGTCFLLNFLIWGQESSGAVYYRCLNGL